MRTLVLETCGPSCGVCIGQDGQVLARLEESMQRGQDARLIPMVMDVLTQARLDFPDLDRIVVTRGPGSFTGVRVGLAAARGIGIASGKPVIGLDRFSLYKFLFPNKDKNLLVIIDSKRAELFCTFFPPNAPAYAPAMMTVPEIETFLTQHPDTELFGDIAAPDADVLTACVRQGEAASLNDPSFAPTPFYLRPPDVTFAKKKP